MAKFTIKRNVVTEIEITDADVAEFIDSAADPISLVFIIQQCLNNLTHEKIVAIRDFVGSSIDNESSDLMAYLDRILDK